MKKVLILILATAVAGASQAAGGYIGLGLGVSKIKNEESRFNSAFLSQVGGSISSAQDTSANNIRAIGGFFLNENLALEVGYTRTNNIDLRYSGVTSSSAAYRGAAAVSVSGLDGSLIFRPSLASGYNKFFASVGFHSYEAKLKTTFLVGSSAYLADTEVTGTGTMYGIGYDYRLGHAMDIRFGLTRLNRIAGESAANMTNYGVTLIKHY